jgi:hypothetical protein
MGAALASVTWFISIRGRGESAQVVFMALGIFVLLTVATAVGLFVATSRGVPPASTAEVVRPATRGQALYHLLTASMKGMVALSGLEAMSNGIQYVRDDDFSLVKWGKKHLARLKSLWSFCGGKSGIGRAVRTAFLFYGGLTAFFLTEFAIRFSLCDGTLGRSLVGNLAFIGFSHMPGGPILFWAYPILAVVLLAFASTTAFQDLQATAWRDVAIGEIPEIVVYRNKGGTFTRSVAAGLIAAIVIQLVVRGQATLAVPYHGVGVF